MATAAQPIAKCILNYLYSQASAILSKLRDLIETMLLYIDAKILELRAIIASLDYAKIYSEFIWSQMESALEEVRSSLLGGVPGPIDDVCPEFYKYITEPLVGIIDGSLSAFTPYKDRFVNMVSIITYFDTLLSYWESSKEILLAILDVIDDALYLASQQAGNSVD